MLSPFTQEQIAEELQNLPGWSYQDGYLKKSFQFQNFQEAISFIVRMAFFAEAQDHHPELFNVYNRVDISLSTHDAGNQVTAKDIQLAKSIESFSWV